MLKTKNRWALTCAAVVSCGVMAQDPAAIQVLREQANFWQSRGDLVKASAAWNKLLAISPNDVEALAGLASAEQGMGRTDSARTLLERLEKTPGGQAQATRLKKSISSGGSVANTALDEARKLAQQKNYDKAVEAYKQHFAGKGVPAALALEYYQTLAASTDGWEPARKGLEGLVKANPKDEAAALALGLHLTYRETSRRQGIALLADLDNSPTQSAKAAQGWRQALVWLNAQGPQDERLLRNYLSRYRDDPVLEAKLDRMGKGGVAAGSAGIDPSPRPVQPSSAERAGALLPNAFELLNAGDLLRAGQAFQQVLDIDSNNPDGLGGLGVVRLRLKEYDQAVKLLTQADARSQDRRWGDALAAARAAASAQRADVARKAGRFAEAEAAYTELQRQDPNSVLASLGLGQLAYEQGNFSKAEDAYRQTLKLNPASMEARVGLMMVYAATGRQGEAQLLLESMSDADLQAMGGIDNLRATLSYEDAQRSIKAGDANSAVAALEDTIAYNPRYPWARLELARIRLKQGQAAQADALIRPLELDPQAPDESVYAAALYYSEKSDYTKVDQLLRRIPDQRLTKEQAKLLGNAEFMANVEQANQLSRLGRKTDAQRLLNGLQQDSKTRPELLLPLISALIDAGDTTAAMRQMQAYRDNQSLSALPVEQGVQYGYLLMKTDQTAELQALMRRLDNVAPANAPNGKLVADLKRAMALRGADSLREKGDFAGAYEVLAPQLASAAEDPVVLSAVARLYATAGQQSESLSLYELALRSKPKDTELLISALNAAAAIQDQRAGERHVSALTQVAPADPVSLTAIGRFYRAIGDKPRAQQYFEQAIVAELKLTGSSRALDANAVPGGVVLREPASAAEQIRRGQIPTNPFSGARTVNPLGLPPVGGAAEPFAGQATVQPQGQTIDSKAAATVNRVPVSVPSASGGFNPLSAPPALLTGTGAAAAVPTPPARTTAAPLINGVSNRVDLLQREIQSMQEPVSRVVHGGVQFRSRKGEAGLSQLDEVVVPIEYRQSALGGEVFVNVRPTVLNAGSINNERGTLNRFGSGPAATLLSLPTGRTGVNEQEYSAVALNVGYQSDIIRFDVGNRISNIGDGGLNGGVGFTLPLSTAFTLDVKAARRPVTDSFLSYAGMRDDRTGVQWGAVNSSGGRAVLTHEVDGVGVYGYAGRYRYDGRNVVDNNKSEYGFGTYYKVLNKTDENFTIGLGFNGFGFEENLSYYTIGHGGYFSPQRYMSVAAPFQYWRKKSGFSYGVSGTLGFQTFKEDAVPFFPGNGALQRRAQEALDEQVLLSLTSSTPLGANYAARSKTGFSYNLTGGVEYKVTQRLMVGALLALDNASNFDQFRAGLYVRMYLDDQNQGLQAPPRAPNVFVD